MRRLLVRLDGTAQQLAHALEKDGSICEIHDIEQVTEWSNGGNCYFWSKTSGTWIKIPIGLWSEFERPEKVGIVPWLYQTKKRLMVVTVLICLVSLIAGVMIGLGTFVGLGGRL